MTTETDKNLDNENERVLTPREVMVNSINNQREATVIGEIEESMVREVGEPGTPENRPEEPEVLEAAPTPAEPSDIIVTNESGERFMEMVVDGVTELVSLDNVKKGYQLEKSSRQRMEETSKWSKELATQSTELDNRSAQIDLKEKNIVLLIAQDIGKSKDQQEYDQNDG